MSPIFTVFLIRGLPYASSVKFHKSSFWVLILAAGGPYWVSISQKKWVLIARLHNLPTMATMVGGTLLFEGAHLIDAIRAFVAKQANVMITPLFWQTQTLSLA